MQRWSTWRVNPVRASCFFSTHGSIMLRTQKAEEFPLGFSSQT